MAGQRSWRAMWQHQAERLEQQTGEDVDAWSRRVRDEAPDDEAGVRRWLDEQGVGGYPQSLLVFERFGWPDFLAADDEDLIDGQYADREDLRPILDRVLAVVRARHPDVEVTGRKTYVPLFTPRRQFAVVQATTRSRVDVGLRLDGREPEGPLLPAPSLANETINVRLPLSSPDDLDDEAVAWLDEAWEHNL